MPCACPRQQVGEIAAARPLGAVSGRDHLVNLKRPLGQRQRLLPRPFQKGMEEAGKELVFKEGKAEPVDRTFLDCQGLSARPERALQWGDGERFDSRRIVGLLGQFWVGLTKEGQKEGIDMVPQRRRQRRIFQGTQVHDYSV